jgi:hypothetical protein
MQIITLKDGRVYWMRVPYLRQTEFYTTQMSIDEFMMAHNIPPEALAEVPRWLR